MIHVSVALDPKLSTLESVDVHGHSGSAGNSVVCAAVSALTRTAARAVESYGKFTVGGGAEMPGDLRFTVQGGSETGSGDYIWLMGVTDYLLTGLRDIEREHPDECRMKIL